MESQFLSPVGVPPHLRSEGIYRVHTSVYNLTSPTYMILTSLTLKKITSLGNLNLTSLPLIILTSQNVAPSVDFGFN